MANGPEDSADDYWDDACGGLGGVSAWVHNEVGRAAVSFVIHTDQRRSIAYPQCVYVAALIAVVGHSLPVALLPGFGARAYSHVVLWGILDAVHVAANGD